MLTKEQILSVDDFVYVEHPVPQWGGPVRIRGLTAKERDEFEASVGREMNLVNFRARFIVRCMVDEEGVQLFDETDADALGNKNAEAIDHIFDAVRKLSGMSDNDMEELEGNSEGTQ